MKNIVLMSVAVICFWGCGQSDKKTEGSIDADVVNNAATAENPDGVDGDIGIPAFSFETEVHDFGTIVQGEKVAYAFKFKNSGDGDLIISSAKGSCGCTIPEYPVEAIPPGGDAVIDVVFNSAGKSGQQRKKVTIVANTVPNTTVLSINGMVEVPEEK